MKILGDSNITAATITATNIVSASFTDKLKTYQLVDNMLTIANSTVIDLTFASTVPNIDCFALCGTNLTSSSTISLSYSDTDIESPDATVALPLFSTLNQIWFLSSTLNKKYWRVTITDTSLASIFIGFIYCGVCLDIPVVEFGHTPSLEFLSETGVTKTGQGYGVKIYNASNVDFTMLINYATLTSYFAIKQLKQNVDPVLIVEYLESYNSDLYRPKYGVLSGTDIPYRSSRNNLQYSVSDTLEERF